MLILVGNAVCGFKCDSKWDMSSKGNGVVNSSVIRNGICLQKGMGEYSVFVRCV